MRHKVGKLAAVRVSVFLRLRGNVFERDDHIAERDEARAGVGVLRAGQLAANGLVEALRG